MKFKITTKLRKGIKDIQGDTISLNVNANGWRVNKMKTKKTKHEGDEGTVAFWLWMKALYKDKE